MNVNLQNEEFGIDKKHKIILLNHKISNTSRSDTNLLNIIFEKGFEFSIELKKISYAKGFNVNYQGEDYTLYFTALPIIKILSDKSVKDDPKVQSLFTYADNDSIIKATAGIEYRGNISLQFPKKSYDLEFWENPEEEISTDVKFDNLREDDDWILDGMYNEPLRLRSFFCNKLWLSIHQPHYLDKEPGAKSGIDLKYTEVFFNSRYIGIHALTEQVDRKLLKLKKYKKRKVRGELFKASSYKGAPSYKKVTKYKNIFPHWAGYEIEYPFINYKAQWKNLYRYTKFVLKSKDSVFKKKVVRRFDLDNAIDYFLFINLVRATDNLGKNFYVARYDKNMPYFNVPWDLDGVLGVIQDGKRISTTDDILSNGLFDRLLKLNPENYRNRLKKRWESLRKKEFSDSSLFGGLKTNLDYFKSNKIYERERIVWPSEVSILDHYRYMESWLEDRLVFLDSYFEKL
ncbi:CotH kinase family protein [Aquimarina amphilecti]|nr:CotH kinase family protein [Aquimarina amphilecti]